MSLVPTPQCELILKVLKRDPPLVLILRRKNTPSNNFWRFPPNNTSFPPLTKHNRLRWLIIAKGWWQGGASVILQSLRLRKEQKIRSRGGVKRRNNHLHCPQRNSHHPHRLHHCHLLHCCRFYQRLCLSLLCRCLRSLMHVRGNGGSVQFHQQRPPSWAMPAWRMFPNRSSCLPKFVGGQS